MAELDLTRLAYIARYRSENLGLSYTELEKLTGCSRRQISYLMNGKAVNAGATFLVAEVLKIDLVEMLSPGIKARVLNIRDLHKTHSNQTITPHVSCEASRMPIAGGGAE